MKKEPLGSPRKLKELESSATNEFRKLSAADMVNGIGRKATNEKLIDYLSNGQGDDPIDIEIAFSKIQQ